MEKFINDNLIYSTIVGSTAYGLNTPESDIDIKGITIPPIDYFFGLKTFKQCEVTKDHTIYGLHKFIKLALNCNPTIIEMLYTDNKHINHINKYGQILRDNRDIFLSKKARHSFGGYAISQLKRIKSHRKFIMNPQTEPIKDDFYSWKIDDEDLVNKVKIFNQDKYGEALKKYNRYLEWKRNRNPMRAKLEDKYHYDVKHAFHLFRLLRMSIEIMRDKEVNVLRSDKKELMDIRNGVFSYDYIIKEAEKLNTELDYLYKKSTLPDVPDIKKINRLLISITTDFLGIKKIF